MRHALAVLLLVASPAAAAPRAPHGPGCALSTTECLQVARELAIEAELDDEDARTFGFGLSAFDKANALVDRSEARVLARLHRLPPIIGNEIGRILLCRSADHLQTIDGTPNTHPECH